MIIFLYGRDGYRLKQNVKKIEDEYRKKASDFIIVDLENNPVGLFEDTLKTVSFFDEKKLIRLENSFKFADEMLGLIKNPKGVPSGYNLLEDKKIMILAVENLSELELNKKSKKLFNLLTAKPNVSKSFEELKGKQLENWIMAEVEANNMKISSSSAHMLSDRVGADSWALKQEIDKLANYCLASGKKAITEDDIVLLTPAKIDLNIFETIDALGSRNRGRSILLLSRHLADGEDPYYLLSMITYQFRNLLRVKSLTSKASNSVPSSEMVAKKTGLHPFVARKVLEQTRKFELEELKNKFLMLARSDIDIKNGGVDIVDCLYQIALS